MEVEILNISKFLCVLTGDAGKARVSQVQLLTSKLGFVEEGASISSTYKCNLY